MDPESRALLVVDDEEETLKAIRRELRRRCHVYTARSAAEAARVLDERSIQVVISDERMPGGTGTALLAQVAATQPDTVRVLLTGYADLCAVTRAINEAGVYRYLTKPWDPAELAAVVEESFERQRRAAGQGQLVADLGHRVSELEGVNAALTREHDAMDVCLGTAAHELRTPTGVIQGFASLLLGAEDATPERRRRYLERIQHNADVILHLADDLLDVSALEQHERALTLEDVELRCLLTVTVASVELRARAKHIAVVVDAPAELPRLRCDPLRVEQVLQNLVGNAIKFSPSGTTVTVRAEQREGAAIVVVDDEGPGIRPEERGALFTRFSRTSTRPTGGETSTGLGLWICKQIVQQHGGAITAESAPGGGARFSFTLPLAGPPPTEA